MTVIAGDVRQAFRRIRSTPLVSFAAVLTVALGIGSSVVMTDMLDRLLVRAPAHVTDPDRVARAYVGSRGSYFGFTGYATFEAITTLGVDLEASAAYFTESLTLGRGQHAGRWQRRGVSCRGGGVPIGCTLTLCTLPLWPRLCGQYCGQYYRTLNTLVHIRLSDSSMMMRGHRRQARMTNMGIDTV